MKADICEVERLRNTLGAHNNDQIKDSLELFKRCFSSFLPELVTLVSETENWPGRMIMHWLRDEDKRSTILAYFRRIPGLDDWTEETTEATVFKSVKGDMPLSELFLDYLVTSTDVVPLGERTYNLAEQIAASPSISVFHERLLTLGYTSPRGAAERLFRTLIQRDHVFRELEFRRWRTAHKKTMKFGKQAVQSGTKAVSSVKHCSNMKDYKEAVEEFVEGLEVVQKFKGRKEAYEQMIDDDLERMGELLGVADLDPFLQLPYKDREKVFDGCNRFRLHKSEVPQASED